MQSDELVLKMRPQDRHTALYDEENLMRISLLCWWLYLVLACCGFGNYTLFGLGNSWI